MSPVPSSHTNYLLRKTVALYGRDLAFRHPWIWEVDRWKELVFALLVQVSGSPEDRARQLVGHLADLDLLDISSLASLCSGSSRPNLDEPLARQILEFLTEAGLSRAVAERAVITISEAALAFQTRYGGKVQRYLRSYGEIMLKDLDSIFQFSSLGRTEMRRAFIYWLQNALNMPLSFSDQALVKFCKANHITPDELGAAADDLNLNQAVVDDLTDLWVRDQPNRQTPA